MCPEMLLGKTTWGPLDSKEESPEERQMRKAAFSYEQLPTNPRVFGNGQSMSGDEL